MSRRHGSDRGVRQSTGTTPMSSQVSVHSVESLKDFRVALALVRRRYAWRPSARSSRRCAGRSAGSSRSVRPTGRSRSSGVASRSPGQGRGLPTAAPEAANYTPSMSEQMEHLHKAEASLQDAEKRLIHGQEVATASPACRPGIPREHAEAQGPVRRGVPSAVNLLSRLIDALESYLQRPAALGDRAGIDARPGPRPRWSPSPRNCSTRPRPRRPPPEPGAGRGEAEPSRALDAPDADGRTSDLD